MFYYNGQGYELPKKTLALNDKIEAVRNAKSTRDSYMKMMDFVMMALGKEKVNSLLGTANIQEVDLTELNILANAIVMGYDLKVAEAQMQKANEIANSDAITNVIEAGKSVRTLNNLQK